MARIAKPWYRAAEDSWYAWIDGKQVRLARGKDRKTEASRRLRELLTARDRGQPADPAAPLVGDIAADYEADLVARRDRGELSAQAVDDFRRRSAGFVELHGDVRAADLKPFHVEGWLATRANLGPTSRHDAVGAVKAITAWAFRQGLLPADPLAGVKKPPRKVRREKVMDAGQIPALLAKMDSSPFRDLLSFLYLTGCRPAEATALEARHLDLKRGLAVLPEHKTRRKTDAPRLVILPPAALKLVKPLAKAHPEGPLLRNARGGRWTKDAINSAIRRLRDKVGAENELVAYALRHAFATDALAAGQPIAIVAELMGHADTRMLSRVYSHLARRTDVLSDAAKAVRGGRKAPK
jgi:integrase